MNPSEFNVICNQIIKFLSQKALVACGINKKNSGFLMVNIYFNLNIHFMSASLRDLNWYAGHIRTNYNGIWGRYKFE